MFDPIETLKRYIACRSVSADSAFAAGMADARDFVRGLLESVGMRVQIVDTPKHPIVVGTREGDASWPHVVIYGHYDVQPPDPLDLWKSEPFVGEIREGRLYGRGAADNKGPFLVHLTALGRLLEEQPDLPLRVTVVVEGEEEIGSPSFGAFLAANRERLRADLCLLSDTGIPSPEQIVITCGLRGIFTFDLEITGPQSDLHSGLHGGVLHNPIQALTEILASLHDASGRVAIDGFYDAVRNVEDWERDELRRLGKSTEDYRRFLGIRKFHTAPGFDPFEATRFQPTLEINGIGGGYQGEGSKTVIPARAFAKLSCRLVPDQEPEAIWELVSKAIESRCPPGVRAKLTFGHKGRPYVVVPPGRPNTPADQSPALAAAFAAADAGVNDVFGRPPLYLREGGSIPIIADLKTIAGLDSLMLGLFLPEDNLHAPNESFHLGVMEKGIEVSRRILASVAGARR
jgi:acetylornithine deacetylase/succinyl-diaminopimelate desuccinylase-like protein